MPIAALAYAFLQQFLPSTCANDVATRLSTSAISLRSSSFAGLRDLSRVVAKLQHSAAYVNAQPRLGTRPSFTSCRRVYFAHCLGT